ncbi:hypothetical protein ACMG5L_22195 [Escherichia coli]|uniref:hypothetical protein n=1 Tax=Escherichia coli TaxID=562 RepID=UPI0039BF5616
MSIKERIQQLIETNQQQRITELINTVNHIFDKFEESLNDDIWDTDIVNGKAYLQKTVSDDDILQFLGIGLTDSTAVIQALLPPCLNNVDVLAYKQHLSEIFQTRTSKYEYPIRLAMCFPTGSNDSGVIIFDTKEISTETGSDNARTRIDRIVDMLVAVARAASSTPGPKNGCVYSYEYEPLRRIVTTQTDEGINVIGIVSGLSVIDNNDLESKRIFETRLRNCASRYKTSVTFTLCFHPAIVSWETTVNKENSK